MLSKILPIIFYTKGTHHLLTASEVLVLIGSMSSDIVQCSICVLVNLHLSSQPNALANMGIAGEPRRVDKE